MITKILHGFENFIADGRLTQDEVIIIKWQYGYFGGFYTQLVRCFRLADVANRSLLAGAFPEIGDALDRYDSEDGFFTNCERKAEELKLNSKIGD